MHRETRAQLFAPTSHSTAAPQNKCKVEYWGNQRGVGFGDGSQTTPAPLPFVNGTEYLDISAGPQYTLSVDANNDAFASGYINDMVAYDGRFGVANPKDNLQQGNNKNKKIDTVLYLNEDGSTRTAPAPKFRRVYTGAGGEDVGHSAFMDTEGKLFFAGSSNMGQLCSLEKTDIPREVAGLPSGFSILDVALGREFTLILLNNGQVYGCGSNKSGQLGLDKIESAKAPTLIKGFGTHQVQGFGANLIQAISAGQDFSLFQSIDGRIFGTGVNSDLQLCNNNTANIRIPTVRILVEKRF